MSRVVGVQNIEISNIDLDFTNPRISRILEMYSPDKITAEQISLALGTAGGSSDSGENYTSYRSLKESIRCHGCIIHPIIVNKINDKYIVIEGNTRVQIYRDFIKKGINGKWDTIPSLIHENLSQKEIDSIRLQAHLVGPRPWQAYSKAKYLNNLRNAQDLTMEQIIELCGGKRQEILRYIDAFNDMEEYYRPALREGETFDPLRFSAYVELQKNRTKDAIIYNGFTIDDFSRWIIDEKIFPLAKVRQLSRVLNHADARATFIQDENTIDDALQILNSNESNVDLLDFEIIDLLKAVSQKISHIPFREVKHLKTEAGREDRMIYEIAKESISQIIDEFEDIDAE